MKNANGVIKKLTSAFEKLMKEREEKMERKCG